MSDFFVSYTKADEQWAEWIGWVLEEAGFAVTLQAWVSPLVEISFLKCNAPRAKRRAPSPSCRQIISIRGMPLPNGRPHSLLILMA